MLGGTGAAEQTREVGLEQPRMLGQKFKCGSCAFGGEELLKSFKQKGVMT